MSSVLTVKDSSQSKDNLFKKRHPQRNAKHSRRRFSPPTCYFWQPWLTWKFPWKSCSTTHLAFLSSNRKILKAFLKTFPTKMKPTKCPAREKKWGKKEKSKSQDCCVTFKPQNSKLSFLHMPELRKLIFCIWIRRPRSERPANSFVVSFSSV